MKKIFTRIICLTFIGTILMPILVPIETIFASESNIKIEETQSIIKDTDIDDIIAELKNENYLEYDTSGDLYVTEKYVAQVQENLGEEYNVFSKNGTLSIQKVKSDINSRVKRYALFPETGETKIEFTKNSIDLYLDGVMCFYLKVGTNITSIIFSLIPIPTIGSTISNIINMFKSTILGKDNGQGVIISLKVTEKLHIPYFITFSSQKVQV